MVALPADHPLVDRAVLNPQDLVGQTQIAFHHNVEQSFQEWTSGTPIESVICTVNTARAALDLVGSGMGIAFIANECVENRPDVRYVPLSNWHQALYMCILYDKWLEPPVWDFIELIVKAFRQQK